MVKLVLASLVALSLSSAARAACEPDKVLVRLRNENQSSYTVPGPKAKIYLAAALQPGETKNVQVMVDDFPFSNPTAGVAEVFVAIGSSQASNTTAWGIVVHAQTCAIISAREVLHTGGGGL